MICDQTKFLIAQSRLNLTSFGPCIIRYNFIDTLTATLPADSRHTHSLPDMAFSQDFSLCSGHLVAQADEVIGKLLNGGGSLSGN